MKVPIKEMWKGLTGFVNNNSSTILTVIAVSGVFATAAAAIKMTPKATEILENRKRSMEDLNEDKDEMSDEEYKEARKQIYISFAKDMAKVSWPVVLSAGITVTSIIGAHKIDTRKRAALAATLSITESKFKDYREKTKEVLGEKKEQKLRDDICKDKVKSTPTDNVIDTGKGDVLCLDAVSGRYFKCNADFIRNRVNFLNNKLLSEMWISLNELYSELNLPSIRVGEDIGWNINKDGLIEVDFSSQLTEDDRPVLVLDYTVEPRWDYKSLH
ncbi:MAG: hypothetical protein J6Y02_09665 [Pseudobutyrivibrio sp.]|nr:hypothetical protein [Pseudobutyrivibrio sp.]